MSNIPRAFRPAKAPSNASAAPAPRAPARNLAPAPLKRKGPPRLVLPPKRQKEDTAAAATAAAKATPSAAPKAAAPAAAAPVTAKVSATALATPKAAPAAQKKEPQPSPRVRSQPLERGMIVAYQETPGTCDASVGTVDSVFAAINEVWIIPEDAEDASVRCNTSQVTFLGSWSKTLEIINSIDVPADVEAIMGPEQMDQVQDLAQAVPCHLESLSADATSGSSPAQLVFGPAPARAVKLAVEAVVSQVEGLEFPDVNLSLNNANSDPNAMGPWAMPMSNVPMMVVPMWPTAAGWTVPVETMGWQATGSAGDLGTFTDLTDPAGLAPDADAGVTPPWRQDLEPPPPPKRVSAMASPVRVKRFRRTQKTTVKEELEPGGSPSPSAEASAFAALPEPTTAAPGKTEPDSSLLYWATRQHLFKDLPTLPDGWIRVASKSSGGIYYVNLTTGKATFDSPLPKDVEKSTDLPPGWEVVTSKSTGKQYYWNPDLQISQFERPT